MKKNRHKSNTSFEEIKILIISEDSKSFLVYFEKVLDGFGIKRDKGYKKERLFRKVVVGPKRSIEVRMQNITNCLKNVEFAIAQSEEFTKIYCVFDYLKNGKDESYKRALGLKIPQNVERVNSVPSYEFWLLLHFLKTSKQFLDNDGVIKDLETEVRKFLGKNFEYSKSQMSEEFFRLLEEKNWCGHKKCEAPREGK
jgi:hypothetical protein